MINPFSFIKYSWSKNIHSDIHQTGSETAVRQPPLVVPQTKSTTENPTENEDLDDLGYGNGDDEYYRHVKMFWLFVKIYPLNIWWAVMNITVECLPHCKYLQWNCSGTTVKLLWSSFDYSDPLYTLFGCTELKVNDCSY